MADIDQLSISITASAKTASDSIDDLAARLANLRSQLGRISTKSFSNSLDRLSNSSMNLSKTMGGINVSVRNTSSGLNLWSSSASKATKRSFSLASAIGKVYATYWMLFRALGSIKKSIDIAADLTEVENVVDHSFKNMKDKLEDFIGVGGIESMKNYGISELEAKRVASRYMSMASNMDITREAAADMSIEMTKLAADLASFYNEDFATAAEKLNAVFTGQTRPLRQYGLDLTQATLKEWAMTQGLNANMQAMTQAEKTLLRYQYVLSHTNDIQGDFLRTSSSWSNQIKLLKMQFQALGAIIGEGFINLLRPALQKLTSWMNTLIALVRKVVNAIGKLLGWQMQITDVGVADEMGAAASGAEDMADDLGQGAKEAKKMKDYLLGIDELNIFRPDEDDEGSGSGSGKGAGGGATGGGGGRVSGGEVQFVPYESDVKDWYDLGKRIAEWLTEAMNNIDWDSIQQKAREVAAKLADFLNGFIDYEPFWIAIGHTIAQGMNTALYFAETFLDKMHWAQFGKDIGLMLNQWAREFDWEALGRVLAKNINAFFTVLYEAGKEFDPVLFGEGVYKAINSFFETLDTEKIALALNAWADNLFEFITTVVNGLHWDTIWDKAKTFLETINVRAVSIIFGALLVKGLTKAKLLTAVSKALGVTGLDVVGAGITIAATIWFTLKLKDDVTDRFKKFNEAGGFSGTLKEIADRWRDVAREAANANKANPYTPERAADMQAFRDWIQQIKDKFTETHEATKKYFDDLDGGKWSWVTIDGLRDKISEIKEKFDALTAEDVWDFLTIDDSFLGQFTSLSTAIDGIKTSISEAGQRIKEVFGTESTWLTAFGSIKPAFEQAWNELVTWWRDTAIYNWWNVDVLPWFSFETWYTLLHTIYDAWLVAWDELMVWWKDTAIYEWWENNVKPWFATDTWHEVTQGIPEGLGATWDEMTSWWRDTAIHNWIENDVKPKFKKDYWITLLKGMKEAWNEVWTKVTDKARELVHEMYLKVLGWIDELATKIGELATAIGEVMSAMGEGATQMYMAQYGMNNPLANLPGRAEGGYVSSGQLFMARENGIPEMVGSIGRTTAVANNDQIVEAISLGVAMANSGVIDGLASVVSAINNKDTSVNIGDREIALAVASGQSLLGRSIIS